MSLSPALAAPTVDDMNRSPVTFLIWCHFPHFCHLFWQLRSNCVTLAWKDSLSQPFFSSRKRGMNLFCLVPWFRDMVLQEIWHCRRYGICCNLIPWCSPKASRGCNVWDRDVSGKLLSWSGEHSGRRWHWQTQTWVPALPEAPPGDFGYVT